MALITRRGQDRADRYGSARSHDPAGSVGAEYGSSRADSDLLADDGQVLSRRGALRTLGVSSALAFLGAAALPSALAADQLGRTTPNRFRLTPQVDPSDPPSTAANKGYVDSELAAQRDLIDAEIEAKVAPVRNLTESVISAGRALVAADAGRVVAVNSSSAVNVTVPTHASVPFPAGTVVNVYRAGSGTVTILRASGVTVRASGVADVTSARIPERYGEVSLRKRADNEWVLVGDFEE